MESKGTTEETRQVKSRERVRDHGEVFTAEREVKAMCDLVKGETERIDSRFLEPACGDGNFLSEILSRKLASVTRLYRRRLFDWEVKSLVALGSLYGVDILGDNAAACRERLFRQWDSEYVRIFKAKVSENVRKSARFILDRNIVRGNALSMREVDDNARDTDVPIVFSQWTLLSAGTKMRREDFEFASLLAAAEESRSIVPDAVPIEETQGPDQPDLFEAEENGGGLSPPSQHPDGHFLGSKLYPSRRVFDE